MVYPYMVVSSLLVLCRSSSHDRGTNSTQMLTPLEGDRTDERDRLYDAHLTLLHPGESVAFPAEHPL